MKKLLMMAGAAVLSVAARAAQNDLLITFSTPGPDAYADGVKVLDGECYALVWSKDGVFEGIRADGAPVDAGDQVVLVAPVAKDGKCPTLVYQVAADVACALAGGQYAVYLLDTRVKAADGSVALAQIVDGKPVAVNATTAVGETSAVGGGAIAQAMTTAVGGVVVKTETVVDVPRITGVKIGNATVKVTVSGMSPTVTYKVFAGETPDAVATPVEAQADGDTFEFAKPKGQFFKVIGTRNF